MTQFNEIYQTRCPIHGSIPFNERERSLIDHPFCQRLRHISQLGFASYVYTGATHKRLGHSLGVMHLAGRIFDQIVNLEKAWLKDLFHAEDLDYFRQILRFAALLHDVGHAPFSHSFESMLPAKASLDLPRQWYADFDPLGRARHEDFSVAIVYALAQESPPLLSLQEAQDVCSLIDPKVLKSASFSSRHKGQWETALDIHPLLKHLISGEVDADRMDYLHRDSHYAGVNYGKFDMNRIVESLSCLQTDRGIVLVLDHAALHTFENFLLARLHMFLQVYFHKTLLPFDHCLRKALEENEIDFKIDGNLEHFLGTRDDLLMAALFQSREKPWSKRIIFRETIKKLFKFEHYHPAELHSQMIQTLSKAGITHYYLESHSHLTSIDPMNANAESPLLLKNPQFGKTQYIPVERASLLIKQYPKTADIRYLYCEEVYYPQACQLLSPLVNS